MTTQAATTTLSSRSGWSTTAVAMFLTFAFAYFLSTMLRAVTATLAPVFSAELALSAADLGLLAGAYFFGFSLTQLPLGKALDRFGPRRVMFALLSIAAISCAAFAWANTLTQLVLARALIGVGVSACLMAPLTAYRRTLPAAQQLRANAWMLMTGSLGMLASTLPVHWLVPIVGWRGLFLGVAVLLIVAIGLIAAFVPTFQADAQPNQAPGEASNLGYREIFTHPRFVQLVPAGLFLYGGLIAIQSLWAGPWMSKVYGATSGEAAKALFTINLVMLVTFFSWGLLTPRMAARGVSSDVVLRWGMALPLVVLVVNVMLGPEAGTGMWALWCVASSVVTLSQPLVAQQFPAHVAGRALSAYNLILFIGIFGVQWGLGVAIDAFRRAGFNDVQAFRAAFALFAACCVASYLWYWAMEWRLRKQGVTRAGDNSTS